MIRHECVRKKGLRLLATALFRQSIYGDIDAAMLKRYILWLLSG